MKIFLRDEMEVDVDENMVDFLRKFSSKSWYLLSGTVKLGPRVSERILIGKLPSEKSLVTLNRVIWWRHHGEWPAAEMSITHINNDPSDYRIQNLELWTPQQRAKWLKKYATPASETKGIYRNKYGHYRVRGYDPETKSVRYIGSRPTLEEARELKRGFLNGDFSLGEDTRAIEPHRKTRRKPVIPALPSEDAAFLLQFSDEALIGVLWMRLFGESPATNVNIKVLKKRIWEMMKRYLDSTR